MKKIIDILAIGLPALLILFALIRYFVPGLKKKVVGGTVRTPAGARILNVLGNFFLVVLLLAGIFSHLFIKEGSRGSGGGNKLEQLAVSKHSRTFNESVQSMLDAYYKMTEAFVNWDTVAVNQNAVDLKIALDNLKTEELKKDSTEDAMLLFQTAEVFASNISNEVVAIPEAPSLARKRELLNSLSDNLRIFLVTVQYDQGKLYWQECPTAFGDDSPGNWLSPTKVVRNPYMGLKHPRYKDGMLECGGPKDTINFIIPDSTQKL